MNCNFEDAVMSEAMPVNAIAACNRLIDLLRENQTNSARSANNDWRVRAIVWWLMVQITGIQLSDVNMSDFWDGIERLRRNRA